MANPWFKFYGTEYLSDTKFLGMDGNSRSCWTTLLSYACAGGGVVKYLTEDNLMIMAGVPLGGDEWAKTTGILSRFVDKGMIEIEGDTILIKNWEKRQTLTPYDRVKRHREKMKNDNEMITTEENREDKNRREIHAHRDWLTNIPPETVKELSEKYEASTSQVKRKGEELSNYCLAKGKVYKNYRAFLENALNRDFGRRPPKKEIHIEKPVHLDPEEQERVDKLKREISSSLRVKV